MNQSAHYNNLKLFQHPEHLNSFRNGNIMAPVHIRLKPINRCNHNCYYCAYSSSNLQLGEKMNAQDEIPLEKMRELVNDFSTMGIKAVTLSGGGEPLLYPHIVELLDRLNEKEISIGIISNGSLLNGETASAVARNAKWIRISIDGFNNESYSKIRGVSHNEFEKVISNIQSFSSKECVLGTNIIVSHHNASNIASLCKKLDFAGASHIKLSQCIISNNYDENLKYHNEIMSSVRLQIQTATDQCKCPIINHYDETPDSFQKDYTTCPFLQFLSVIGADCNIYSCQDKAYTEKGLLGSIKDQSFETLWSSPQLKERIYALNPSKDCKHHCVTHSKNKLINNYCAIASEHAQFI